MRRGLMEAAVCLLGGTAGSRLLCLCLLLYTHSSLAQDAVPSTDHPKECVSIDEGLCPVADSPCPCALSSPVGASHPSVLCCHLASADQLWVGISCAMNASAVGEKPLVALHIRNSTLGGLALSLDAFPQRPQLSSLSVTNSVIPLEDLAHEQLTAIASSVVCLNLSSNDIGDPPAGALMGLSQLKALDLSHNSITHLPDLPPRASSDQQSLWVDISGNRDLSCSGIKEAMSWNASVDHASHPTEVLSNSSHDSMAVVVDVPSLPSESQPPVIFHNKENTFCISEMKDLWFHWVERIRLDKIEYITKLQCARGQGYTCSCSITRFEQSEFAVAVDCSGLGLTELPETLPKHTISLNVTNNKISNLKIFGTNEHYNKIRDFYAENNLITTIQPLEGSQFLNNFQNFFLRGNKLKDLPMYLLKRIFNEDSQVIRHMTLGKNEYHCDCPTSHGLKEWILTNKREVIDYDEMRCELEPVPGTRIIDLQADVVCVTTDWKDYLPYVIMLEVLLLITIVAKVTYDYWIFKTKGYLPWPASRTPKLPCCDWAFDA